MKGLLWLVLRLDTRGYAIRCRFPVLLLSLKITTGENLVQNCKLCYVCRESWVGRGVWGRATGWCCWGNLCRGQLHPTLVVALRVWQATERSRLNQQNQDVVNITKSAVKGQGDAHLDAVSSKCGDCIRENWLWKWPGQCWKDNHRQAALQTLSCLIWGNID